MLPIWPEIVDSSSVSSGETLAVVAFGGTVRVTTAHSIHIPIRSFEDSKVEVWRSALPVVRSAIGEVSAASNGEVMIGSLSVEGADTEALTAGAYAQILHAAHTAGYPHLLRVWNHVGAINACEGTLERYRRFCVGRHAALTRGGYARQQFPAASAVGMGGAGLAVYFLASRAPGTQVENPRQVAAYDYPPAYGPRSPSFSRATVARFDGEGMLFISGTSSVVGHETRHAGDVAAQVDETLRNLDRIIREAGPRTLDDLRVVKTYIRRAADYESIRTRVEAATPRARHLFLESDICRSDLLVEIEGVV